MTKAYIRVVDPKDAEGILSRAYRRIGGKRGSIANVHQSQSLNPKAMLAHLDLYMSLMYSESPLSRIQRELIGTVVSYFNNCKYCITHHYEALKANWDSAPNIEALIEGKSLTQQDKVIVEYCKILTLNPTEIDKTSIDHLKNQNLSDRAILDINMITSYFNFVNRIVLGLGVKLESEDKRKYNY